MNWRLLCLLLLATSSAFAADRLERDLDREFSETVRPFLETYCFHCHGAEKQKGKLDLRPFTDRAAVAQGFRQWQVVVDKLKAQEMPPEEAELHPAPQLRQRVIDWSQSMRQHEARRHAGDPGPVLARRLSNAEYDYSIRDLTGVDLRPAQEFPVDPANEAGFDNSGESLAMSPVLLKKYLEAARRVAQHMVLTPDGFVFASHPVITESDRDKYCVKRIVDFYQRHNTHLADYFFAAWQFKHRAAMGRPRSNLAGFVTDKLSPKYLATVWSTLESSSEKAGPLAALQSLWRQLPAPAEKQADVARPGCERMRNFVVAFRQRLQPEFTNLSVRGIAAGSQPLVLWKDRQMAAARQSGRVDLPWLEALAPLRIAPPLDAATEKKLATPADERGRTEYQAALRRFCTLFPDEFVITERGLIFQKEDKESVGRLLSAGFHLMTGYFRDDAPLAALLLDERQQRELNALWDEFHFITLDSARQYKDFIFFERAEPPRFMQGEEFDFARSEDKDATSAAKIQQLAEAYQVKARRNGGRGAALDAIADYFKNISADIQRVEQARRAAEPKQLAALQRFAERAYRRPLSSEEHRDLQSFHDGLRRSVGLDHEEALRDTVVSVLMSPSFCYRLDVGPTVERERKSTLVVGGASTNTVERWKIQPLSDYALASRLSYFLWSSLPDAELLALAKSGDLHRPKVLMAQTRRMLQDDRVRGLAVEFGGNWLDFRRFEEHNSVDRARFNAFDNELRQAMFLEPIQFFLDVIRRDRPVLDFLNAHDTFVNASLARHYGVGHLSFGSNEWKHVDNASDYGRGGLLPMSVFLTKNAPGLRTSPVKRGYWVVRRLLGEEIPPPPPNVPELPSDEGKLGDRTVRELLARHREDKSCAGCHARFDAMGLVFEGYGPIGERRERDLGGRPVETRANFPGGSEGAGIEGLQRYLNENRREEFLDNLCRKLLAYALGRTLLLSDESTIIEMRAKLAAHRFGFCSLVETIVVSPQFLMRRVSDDSPIP